MISWARWRSKDGAQADTSTLSVVHSTAWGTLYALEGLMRNVFRVPDALYMHAAQLAAIMNAVPDDHPTDPLWVSSFNALADVDNNPNSGLILLHAWAQADNPDRWRARGADNPELPWRVPCMAEVVDMLVRTKTTDSTAAWDVWRTLANHGEIHAQQGVATAINALLEALASNTPEWLFRRHVKLLSHMSKDPVCAAAWSTASCSTIRGHRPAPTTTVQQDRIMEVARLLATAPQPVRGALSVLSHMHKCPNPLPLDTDHVLPLMTVDPIHRQLWNCAHDELMLKRNTQNTPGTTTPGKKARM